MTTIYDVLRRPLVTEKTNYQVSKLNQYSFEVADNATKTMVKDAIETLFDVKVVQVNIVNTAAKRGRRAKIQVNIGKPFGPFKAEGRGQQLRDQLDEIGHEIMRHIAELLPQEQRGHYSSDPAIREAARGTEIYPWADKVEGQVRGVVR